MSAVLLTIITKAFALFLVLDPIGNTGIIATLISGFSQEQQKKILIREIWLALLALLVIFFAGRYLILALNISQAAITITGGIVFILFSISLLFPQDSMVNLKNLKEEPFFVPIAMPLVVGPSSIATVILFSHDESQWLSSLAAVVLAWAVSGSIIVLGPFLLQRLGRTGMRVAERMIGMVCALIAVKMILSGIKLFIADLS